MSAALEVQPKDLDEYTRSAESVERALEATRSAEEVTDAATEEAAIELLGRVKATVKSAKAFRLSATEPHREATKAIDAEFKELVSPLEGAMRALEAQILAHRQREEEAARQAQREEQERVEAERKRLEENARKRQEEEDAKASAEGRAAVEQKPFEIEDARAAPPPEKTKATATGTKATVKDNWKFEVLDVDQVPDEFVVRQVDGTQVKAAIRAGKREIPGLRIYNDAGVAVSS